MILLCKSSSANPTRIIRIIITLCHFVQNSHLNIKEEDL